MSIERSFEPWEEMQRHGQDLADRLAQGFSGFIQSPISHASFAWPSPPPKTPIPFDAESILDIGNRFSRAGAEFGAGISSVMHQFSGWLPAAFRQDDGGAGGDGVACGLGTEAVLVAEKGGDEEGFDLRGSGHFGRPQVGGV